MKRIEVCRKEELGPAATRLEAEPETDLRPMKCRRCPHRVMGTEINGKVPVAAIEIERLSKRFGDVTAVDDLSFTVREGAVTGFLGPNGAGKSTTLRMLLGLVTPTSGTATIGGKRYAELDAPFRHAGVILEADAFHPGRRARDHLRVLATAAGLPLGRVDCVLAEVDLADAGHRRVKGFSLGMRQRLGLAAALLGEPQVLILDEPANGLDPEGVHWLRRYLRAFADAGGTVLISSHVLAEVAQTVDDIVIIAHGRLVTQSSLADLARRSQTGVRVRTPQAEALRSALTGQGIAAELVGSDVVMAFGTTTDAVGLAAAGVSAVIYEMAHEQFDLEGLFLELTTQEGVVA
jgi:ABC-2 type transport system ATP-binding protein